MYQFLTLCLLGTAMALTDMDTKCIQDNSAPLSNYLLQGSWSRVYRFSTGGTLPPSCSCIEDQYTKPTHNIVQEYKDKYNDPDPPYSLDDHPVLKDDGYWQGMVTGNQRAKFYVLTPNTTTVLPGGYSVIAYKLLSEKYLKITECAMRGNFRWMLARDKNSSVEEMEGIIRETPEFQYLERQRFCATSNC